jgi:hypothetical protein
MQVRMGIAITTGVRWLVLACALSLVLSCSFDSYPSLGQHAPSNIPTNDGASSTDHTADSMNASGAGAPAAGTTSLSGPLDASALRDAAMAIDAAVVTDDADVSGRSDATAPDAMTPPCRAGNYAGDFMCVVDPTGVTPITVMTQVTFTLQAASPGNALTLANSNLSFGISGFIFAGDLTGQLDCATGTFHADVVNGLFASVLVPIAAPFSGVVDGQFDRAASSLVGSWSFTSPSGATCIGPWSAALQP